VSLNFADSCHQTHWCDIESLAITENYKESANKKLLRPVNGKCHYTKIVNLNSDQFLTSTQPLIT
jgi:hypothetical protein